MAGSTPIYGFPYPQSTDLVADYPTLGQELATDVETVISGLGSGLNIVTPTSIANTGGSASASGGSVTFTGVTSLSLNGVFTSTYSDYRIVFECVCSSTSTAAIRLRMRAAGTDSSSNLYIFGGVFITQSSGPTSYYSGGLATYGSIGGAADYVGAFSGDIFRPQETANTAWVSNYLGPGSSSAEYGTLSGVYTATTSYDGITLYPSTGNITGKVRVYGYQK